MKKKSNIIELSARELQTKMKGDSITRKVKDRDIDYSEIPRFTADKLKEFKRPGRPIVGTTPRKAISIRIEVGILDRLKAEAKKKGVPYQSLINQILKKAI